MITIIVAIILLSLLSICIKVTCAITCTCCIGFIFFFVIMLVIIELILINATKFVVVLLVILIVFYLCKFINSPQQQIIRRPQAINYDFIHQFYLMPRVLQRQRQIQMQIQRRQILRQRQRQRQIQNQIQRQRYRHQQSQRQRQLQRQRQRQRQRQYERQQRKQKSSLLYKYLSLLKPKKIFNNATNVFYQKRTASLQILKIDGFVKYLTLSVILSTLTILFALAINPFEGKCPKNAKCLAYIKCNKGFVLNQNGDYCNFDFTVNKSPDQICINIIENLKYDYGDLLYFQPQQAKAIQLIINDVLQILDISLKDSSNTQIKLSKQKSLDQIKKFLQSKQNQKSFDFKIVNEKILVNKPLYRFSILIRKFFISGQFLFSILVISFILFGVYLYNLKQQKPKSNKIYNDLRQKVIINKTVKIQNQLPKLQQQYGQITEIVWQEIQTLRFNENIIIYQFNGQSLYWKLL